MAAGFPVKADYATGDVLSAANMNDLSATLNYINPTGKTNGYVLTRNSSATGGLEWAAAGGGGGKVLQVVYATTSTEYATTSTTYGDTGLTATITPTASTSKILVIVSQHVYTNKTGGGSSSACRLVRDSTTLYTSERFSYIAVGGNNTEMMVAGGMNYLDSPATTSATTYKTQGAISYSGAGNVSFQWGTNPSAITLIEIGA